MLKAIIFDFDGVIVKSNYPGARVLEKILLEHGVKMSAKQLFPHYGEHPRHILQEMLHRNHIEKIVLDYKKIMTSREYVRRVRTVKGAKRALSALKRKYKLALASGAVKVSLWKVLNHIAARKDFSVVLSGDDVKLGKPHPELLLKALKRLKVSRGEAVYVCDAPNDVLAARRAGVKSVVVLTGVLNRKTAKKLKPDYIISDITKLPLLLKKYG